METKALKMIVKNRESISRAVAMAQIQKAIALQKKGVIKF